MRHTALIYDYDEQMVARVAPYLADALTSGAPAFACLRQDNWVMLHEQLGAAADEVSYTDCDAFYTSPMAALATYDAEIQRSEAAAKRPAAVVGELPRALAEREWREWSGYEALLNHSLARHRASVFCVYDSRAVSERLIEAAVRAHPMLVGDSNHNAHFEEPADILRSLAVPPAAIPPLPPIEA